MLPLVTRMFSQPWRHAKHNDVRDMSPSLDIASKKQILSCLDVLYVEQEHFSIKKFKPTNVYRRTTNNQKSIRKDFCASFFEKKKKNSRL